MIQTLGYEVGAWIDPHHDLQGAFQKSMAILSFVDCVLQFNEDISGKTYGKNEIELKAGDVLVILKDSFADIFYKHSILKLLKKRMAVVIRQSNMEEE